MVWTCRHLHAICAIVPLVTTLPCLDAAAQGPPGDRPLQGTFSLGFGLNQPGPSSFSTQTVSSDLPNVETFTGKYLLPRGPAFDIAGGAVHRSGFGFGVAYSRASSTGTGDFTIVLDHPRIPPASGSASEDDITRTKVATHLYLSYTLPLKGRFSITFVGGPSYVSLRQDVVSRVDGDEVFDFATRTLKAEIEEIRFNDERASAWGYHVGADVSVQVMRRLSLGMLVRYTRATVELDDPLNEFVNDERATTAVKVGGLQVTSGVRFKF